MATPPPFPFDQSPGVTPPPLPPTRGQTAMWFFAGLLGGAAISAVDFFLIAPNVGDAALIFILAIPALKLAAGITLVVRRDSRALGAGLLSSIPLVILALVGTCFAVIAGGGMH
jgi:peptidoglycan/LPS O-acetylase OafA/YrhL